MAVVQRVASPQETLTDDELVSALRAGSDRAFEELFSRYHARARGYIQTMVADSGRAEDITQEVFISALRRLRVTNAPIAFRPWLFEIAHNACIDEARRSGRVREVALPEDESDVADGPLLARVGSGPEGAIESKQRFTDLRGAFQGLLPGEHQLIVWREFEGRSYDEIGARAGMSRASVESSLFRARRKLGREYQELISGRRCEQVQATVIDACGDERRLQKLGVRCRRQMARHLAHCQSCRRVAHTAGCGEAWFRPPARSGGQLAASLPLPWLPWVSRRAQADASSPPAAGHASLLTQPLQAVMAVGDPTGPWHLVGRAAATAAAVLVAGIGGSIVTGHGTHWIPVIGSGQADPEPARGPAPVRAALPGLAVALGVPGPSASALGDRGSTASVARRAAPGTAAPGRAVSAPRSPAGQATGPGAASVAPGAHGPSAPQVHGSVTAAPRTLPAGGGAGAHGGAGNARPTRAPDPSPLSAATNTPQQVTQAAPPAPAPLTSAAGGVAASTDSVAASAGAVASAAAIAATQPR